MILPRVCSLPRSGTHFLMAALAANFELGDLAMEATGAPGTVWYADNKNPAVVPWGKLFLSHGPYTPALGDPRSILYVYRNLIEVQHSCARAGLRQPSYDEWTEHTGSYINAGAFVVRYDCFFENYHHEMALIRRHFQLADRQVSHSGFIEVQQKVGWVPR